jgi:outer membrane protein assembly factor BamA
MRILIFAILFLGLSTLTSAQRQNTPSKHRAGAVPSSAHKLVDIKITGATQYAPAAVIATTGLKIGQTVNEENFKEAVQKLGETGLFSKVGYSFGFNGEGTKLTLELADNDKLVPVQFDNLVWYSRQELLDKIRQAIPLFQGRVPASGDLTDQIADLLSVMLAQKNPQLHLDYLRSGTGANHAIVFSVSGTEIKIGRVEYPGASAAHLPALTALSKKIEGADFQSSTLSPFIKLDLLPIYRKDGYLKASFGEPAAEVVSDKPDETDVNVKLPVQEGEQYSLDKIAFKGSSAFPEQKLRTLIHSETGKPVNEIQLKNDLELLRRLYGTRGHVKAVVESEAEFNDAQRTVTYEVTINEGNVYKMGELVFEGLDDKLTARMREAWKLPEGEPYDSTYPQQFVKQAVLDLSKDGRWTAAVHESVDDKDSTVDVNLAFSKSQ